MSNIIIAKIEVGKKIPITLEPVAIALKIENKIIFLPLKLLSNFKL